MSLLSKTLRHIHSLLGLFGCCYHIIHIVLEYLSYPILVDIILMDPKQEQIPCVSVCIDLADYIDINRVFLHLPKWQTANFAFIETNAEFRCFQSSDLFNKIMIKY